MRTVLNDRHYGPAELEMGDMGHFSVGFSYERRCECVLTCRGECDKIIASEIKDWPAVILSARRLSFWMIFLIFIYLQKVRYSHPEWQADGRWRK